MRVLLLVSFLSLVLVHICEQVHAGSPSQWAERTIYQIVTDRFGNPSESSALFVQGGQPPTPSCAQQEQYCGGTFQGIINHLPFITGMGFDAIWISPVVESYSYHGYDAKDLFSINPHFGGPDGLRELISACHNAGVWVMLDVVGNHMGTPPNYDFSQLNPFNSGQDFHSCTSCPSNCWIQNYQNDQQRITCRIDGLPDLNQSQPFVANTLNQWVKGLVANYSADGLRIDTLSEVNADFWIDFVASAGVYAVGEVFDGRTTFVAQYQRVVDGLLSYPIFFTLMNVFARQQDLTQLSSQAQADVAAFKNVNLLGSFTDNHDNPRFLSINSDYALYKASLAYVLMSPGIPIVYYGTSQGFDGSDTPDNRLPMWLSGYDTSTTLYKYLQVVIKFRKLHKVWQYPQKWVAADPNFVAFSRGTSLTLLTNVGSNGGTISRNITLGSDFQANSKLCNVFYSSDCVQLNDNREVEMTLLHGEVKLFSPH